MTTRTPVLAPTIGSVWKILVAVGDKVEAGDIVLILEAMKMEIPIEAEVSGTVVEVKVGEGDLVELDAVVVEVMS